VKKVNQQHILKFISLIAGGLAAIKGISLIEQYYNFSQGLQIGSGVLIFVVSYFINWYLLLLLMRLGKYFNYLLDNTSIEIIVGATTGLLVGVLLGILSGYPFSLIRGIGNYLSVLVFFLFGYLGLQIGTRRAQDLWRFFPFQRKSKEDNKKATVLKKVLDTSAIIDGRIYDVCLSHFLEGVLLVPVFVIEELQHIADSEDSLRRGKGRRGLDLLSKMQKHPDINIDIVEDSIPEEKEVDMKLIRLCKKLEAAIITNDYNLNKVAEVHRIKVLNINELANAVKVIVYPGEVMQINILKEGKEAGQGVGYLDDGTMVVVEDARDVLGQSVEVVVTSVFQTAAGRMIFTRRIKEDNQYPFEHVIKDSNVHGVNAFG